MKSSVTYLDILRVLLLNCLSQHKAFNIFTLRYNGWSFHSKVLVLCTLLLATASHAFSQRVDAEQRFHYVLHDTLEQKDIRHLVKALEENYERIKTGLRVQSLPVITVQIWAEEDTYQDAMEETLGMRFPGSRGYVTGDREMRLLYHRMLSAQKEAVHEFAHVVSLNLNENFGNNPRWLWEAVAMYAAEEVRNVKDISYLRDGDYPTLQELNEDFNSGRNIYDVGYLLIDYLVQTWDHDHLIALIEANGNVESTLGVGEAEFEKGWQQFVKKNYFD